MPCTKRPKAKPPNTRPRALQQMHHSRHSSGRASLKIGDTWCLMHTSATVLITRSRREHISHIAARSKRSEPTACPYPVGSLQSTPHHPISELRISELPRSKHYPPSFLAPTAHPSILAAHDSYTSRAHIRRNGAKARPRLVAESFDHAVTHFA